MTNLQIVVVRKAAGQYKLTTMGLNNDGAGQTLDSFEGSFFYIVAQFIRHLRTLCTA